MLVIAISSQALDDAFDAVREILNNTDDMLETVGTRVGVAAESVVSDYPAPSGDELPLIYQWTNANGQLIRSKFKSLAAQRGFFAALRAGRIQTPYVRSGTLGKSISSRVDVRGKTAIVSIGTNVKYAPYVIGDPDTEQAAYHKDNWTPLIQDIEDNADFITAEAEDAALQYVEQLFG